MIMINKAEICDAEDNACITMVNILNRLKKIKQVMYLFIYIFYL